MPTTKLIAAAAVAAGLAGGALIGAPLTGGAVESDDPTSTTDAGAGFGRGFGGRHHGGHHVALSAAAEAIGISEDDLRTALEDGQSIAAVAEANGVEVQVVIDALVAEATSRIDEAVADGRIEQDRAEELKADLPDRMAEVVEREGGVHHGGPGGRGHIALSTAAEAIGISEDDLRAALADGQSIADVAEANGVDVQVVVDALVAEVTERLEELEAELPERIADAVEREGFGRRHG